jgi:hypothetical protein
MRFCRSSARHTSVLTGTQPTQAALGKGLCGDTQLGFEDIGHRHGHTDGCQTLGDGPADAPRGAGHDRRVIVEIE